MYSSKLLEELLVKNSELHKAWLELEILLDKVCVKDLGSGMYQIGENCITGEQGLKDFDNAMKKRLV